MGLDMYAYALEKEDVPEMENVSEHEFEEVFYWRKHPDLHGWFEKLYRQKGGCLEFNTQYVEITLEDINNLEDAIRNRKLPKTDGFFFGESLEEYRDGDLEFVKKAKSILKSDKALFYYSWW